jgi:hypothetical protein
MTKGEKPQIRCVVCGKAIIYDQRKDIVEIIDGTSNTFDRSGMMSTSKMPSSSSSSGMMSTSKMPSSNTPAAGGMSEKSAMSGNSAMNRQMAMMPDMAKIQSMIVGGSLLGHVVYGAVLGTIVTVLLVKTRTGREKISR